MNIRVKNLAPDVTEDDLRRIFAEYGTVTDVRIPNHPDIEKRSEDYGFVAMSIPEEGWAAIESLNGRELRGSKIVVEEAEPGINHPRSRGREDRRPD
jgi:RNA recognition motif-containing protein